jgi:hypothetical protein
VVAPPDTRRYQKRRGAVASLFLSLAVAVFVVGQIMRNDDTDDAASVTPVASGLPPVAKRPPPGTNAGSTAPATAVPQPAAPGVPPAPGPGAASAGGFTVAGGYGPVLGFAGEVRRFEVAVETSLGRGDGGDFADEIERILGDPRSWIAGRQFRLQRVPHPVASEFTVYLASARTSEQMCAAGQLRTEGFTSCRLPGKVIINRDRWDGGVPDYGAPLEVYRAYAINHEVGHQLGHRHEACPGRGRPAPVMMQQTYGLRGCVANAWPYLDGERYAGNPID